MEREACVCDHGFERSGVCAEIIIIIIITGVNTGDVSTTQGTRRIKDQKNSLKRLTTRGYPTPIVRPYRSV